MIKKFILSSLTSTVLLSALVVTPEVFADQFEEEINQNIHTIEEAENRVHNLEETISVLQEKVQNAEEELTVLEGSISRNERRTEEVVDRLEAAHNEMTVLQKEIAELEDIIDKRTEQLEQQARRIQVDGQTASYIEFVIQAESLTDVIGRIDIVSSLISSNRKLIRAQVRDMEAVVQKQEKTEQTIIQQNALAAELETIAEDLEQQRLEKEVLVAHIAAERATAESDRERFLQQRAAAEQAVGQLLIAREEAAQAAREAEEQRQAEQLQREEEERAALAVAEAEVEAEEAAATVSISSSEREEAAPAETAATSSAPADSQSVSNSESATPSETSAADSSSTDTNAGSSSNSNANSNTSSNAGASLSSNAAAGSSGSSSTSASQNSSSASSSSSSTSGSAGSSASNAPANTPAPAPVPAPSNGTTWASLSPHANAVLGTPYQWGGTTPRGFDCSGFTQHVFRQVGVSLPRTASGQYAQSQKVSNPRPGDLVFFSEGGGRVTHVGIYTGGGQFIGSQSSTGVAFTSVHSSYWGPRLVGYGRF